MQICLSFKWTGLHFKQWNKIVCVCLFLSGREWCLLHGVIMQSEWINPRETWPVGDGEFPSPKKQPINDRSCKESELSISISLPLLPESHKPVGRACGLSSVTGGEVVLPVSPLWVRPLLVVADATLAAQVAVLHLGTWSLGEALLSVFSLVQLFMTQWTEAHEAPLSTGFFRQEYWSGLPFLSPSLSLY